jgi:hypothetical protein
LKVEFVQKLRQIEWPGPASYHCEPEPPKSQLAAPFTSTVPRSGILGRVGKKIPKKAVVIGLGGLPIGERVLK